MFSMIRDEHYAMFGVLTESFLCAISVVPRGMDMSTSTNENESFMLGEVE